MKRRGVKSAIHYLDDYLFMGPPGSSSCADNLRIALAVCEELGVPVAPEKVVGPSSTLIFLGIELDIDAFMLRLPEDKLFRTRDVIETWSSSKLASTKRELLSLIGLLHHASTVVTPGRAFLRRMIELSCVPKKLHHYVRLNKLFRSDLQWWSMFLESWNGEGFFSSLRLSPHNHCLTSDASGSWGAGAFLEGSGAWFQSQWPVCWAEISIAVKELLPIVVAAAIWGHEWHNKTILCQCDNAAVVAVVNSGSAKDPLLMHFMRILFFLAAKCRFALRAKHIAGSTNSAADAISRNRLSLFFTLFPQAQPTPTELPPALLNLFLIQRPDWLSPEWRLLWRNTMPTV